MEELIKEAMLSRIQAHKAGDIERREEEDWGDYQSRREMAIAEAAVKKAIPIILKHRSTTADREQLREKIDLVCKRWLDLELSYNDMLNQLLSLIGLEEIKRQERERILKEVKGNCPINLEHYDWWQALKGE